MEGKKPFIPKEGKGRLFENRRREGNQPSWRGDAMVNGVHVQISGWDNDDGSISLSIQKKEDRPQQQSGGRFSSIPTPAPKPTPPVDDDPPF